MKKDLIEGLSIVQAGQLLVYVSNRGASVIDDIRMELPVDEVIMVPTVKYVRRQQYSGTESEPDPYLKKLKGKKRGWDTKGEKEDVAASEVEPE
ncbi:hypothetical protein GTO27_03100 [Candidatus Bathyarchaeota archaeon]|nr:hypothetical protein [Candidatus Bathyarchaeota archaeon]